MVLNQLQQLGHEVRHHDLYQESFSPVFTPYERLHHVGNIDEKLEHLPELVPYVHNLQWCDALVLVYPTWWGAQPAILKGWIDRVFMNEVAWVLPEGEARIRPLLTNVRRLVVLTTHGSGKFLNSLQGESGKSLKNSKSFNFDGSSVRNSTESGNFSFGSAKIPDESSENTNPEWSGCQYKLFSKTDFECSPVTGCKRLTKTLFQ